MGNKKAIYDNPDIIDAFHEWFDFTTVPKTGTFEELYDSWHMFTCPPTYRFARMDAPTFRKCLVAAKILQVDRTWHHAPEWTPKRYEIRQATA